MNGGSERARFWKYFALFGAEILLLGIIGLPLSMSLDAFGFCDWGANLTVQYLISHGYRPTIDFAYPYGLLAAFAGQTWFGLFGTAPSSYEAAMAVCDLLIVLALARVASRLRFGPFGIAIIVVAMGYAVQTSYWSLSQALEAVLISQGLAAQTLGNKPRALMFGSAAVLAKPSMGYLYSLLLLVLIAIEIRDRSADRIRASMRAVAPAAIIFVGLLILLASDFGFSPLLHTVAPITGMKNYQARHFGFFRGEGRLFWYDPSEGWFYYLGTVAGFWILATLYLVTAAIAALRRRLTGSSAEASARDELVITCALLHLAFITLFFGNRWSWAYYSYLLFLGVAAAADIGPAYRRLAAALVMVGVISWILPAFYFKGLWTTNIRSAQTAGLWASPRQTAEWSRVLDSVRGKHAVILDSRGAAEVVFKQFSAPVSYFLSSGLSKPSEIERKLTELAHAERVVVALGDPPCYGIPRVPQIRAVLKNFVPLWKGKFFEVLQNRNRGGPEAGNERGAPIMAVGPGIPQAAASRGAAVCGAFFAGADGISPGASPREASRR